MPTLAVPTRFDMSHSSSSATASVVKPNSSGSVIGVACRYRTFGFNAKTAAPVTAAARDPVSDHDNPGDRSGGEGESGDREGDRGCSGAIPCVDLHRKRIHQMRQRQPHGANLLPSRGDAVEDSARDDQMPARVIMAEREAEAMIVDRDESAADRGHGGHRETQPARPRRYNHMLIL